MADDKEWHIKTSCGCSLFAKKIKWILASSVFLIYHKRKLGQAGWYERAPDNFESLNIHVLFAINLGYMGTKNMLGVSCPL